MLKAKLPIGEFILDSSLANQSVDVLNYHDQFDLQQLNPKQLQITESQLSGTIDYQIPSVIDLAIYQNIDLSLLTDPIRKFYPEIDDYGDHNEIILADDFGADYQINGRLQVQIDYLMDDDLSLTFNYGTLEMISLTCELIKLNYIDELKNLGDQLKDGCKSLTIYFEQIFQQQINQYIHNHQTELLKLIGSPAKIEH